MHPTLLEMMVNDRQAEIARAAASAHRRRRNEQPRLNAPSVGLRLDRVHDRGALERLAALEGRSLPPGPFVVAEVAGTLVAALPLAGGAAIADPFRPSAEIVDLLAVRAAQLSASPRSVRLSRRGLRSLAWRG